MVTVTKKWASGGKVYPLESRGRSPSYLGSDHIRMWFGVNPRLY